MPLLPEGETVKLSAPKNIYNDDIVISTDVARFPESKNPMKHRGSCNSSDHRETEMGAARWKNYEFRHHENQFSSCILYIYMYYFHKDYGSVWQRVDFTNKPLQILWYRVGNM